MTGQRILACIGSLAFASALCAQGVNEASVGANPAGVSPQTTQTVPGQPKKPRRVVMVKVADQEIAVEDFMRYISQDQRLVPQATTPEGKSRIVRQMVSDLLLQKAMRMEKLVSAKPGEAINPDEFARGLATLQQKHFPGVQPSEEEMKAFYDAHRGDYGIPAGVRISQIQFRFADDMAAEDAVAKSAVRKRAESALERVARGENFESIASELSENPRGKVAGGDLGFLPLGQSKWLDEAVEGREVGEVTGVLESPTGFDILKITERRDPVTMPYSNVREHVLNRMMRERVAEARELYLAQLAREIPVEVLSKDLVDVVPGR